MDSILNAIVHTLVIILSIVPLIGIALRIWLFFFQHKFHEAIFKQQRVMVQNDKKEGLAQNSNGRERQSVSPFVMTPTATPQPRNSTTSPLDNMQRIHTASTVQAMTTQQDMIRMESLLTNPLTFYLNNKHQCGSTRFMSRLVAIAFLIDVVIISVCSLLHIIISYAVQTAVYLALLIFIQFYVIRISPYRDEFFVRRQFVSELKIVYINFLLWIVTFLLWFFTKTSDVNLDNVNIYNNNSDPSIGIAIRFLLDGNMTLTCFLLTICQFAVPLFRFKNNLDTLSNINVFRRKSATLPIKLFDCMCHREGYYLFMEHLMKEFSVENLLFITEVAFMKNKFAKTPLVPRRKSVSTSVQIAATLKNALQTLSDRNRSNESSVSGPSQNTGIIIIPPNKTNAKHEAVGSGSATLTSPSFNGKGGISPRTVASPSTRMARLRDIPSDGAIISTQSEVENIMAVSVVDLAPDQAEEKYEANKTGTQTPQSESDNERELSTGNQSESGNNGKMMELGVINGKPLTISTELFPNSSKQSTPKSVQTAQQWKIKLPQLPHTVTIAESMKQDNLFDSVDMIYDNFIENNARYQINISSEVRASITKIVLQHRLSVEAQREKLQAKGGSNHVSSLSGILIDVNIFDDACTEILNLLRSSYYRFAQSKPYKVFCAAHDKK